MSSEFLVPAGVIVPYAGTEPPEGWLECNGALISRSKYDQLFAAIGARFGVGDDKKTFNLPDLRGEFIRGWDNKRGVDPNRDFGKLQEDQLRTHEHADPGHTHADSGHTHVDNGHTHQDAGHTHQDAGHTHQDAGHNHEDAGHKHTDRGHGHEETGATGEPGPDGKPRDMGVRVDGQYLGHYHEDKGHAHPYYHMSKIGQAFAGGELTNWDGAGDHKSDSCSFAYANISYAKILISAGHAQIENSSANIQPGYAQIQAGHANIQTGKAVIENSNANIQAAHAQIQPAKSNLGEPVNIAHGAETRPRNIALMYIIKY